MCRWCCRYPLSPFAQPVGRAELHAREKMTYLLIPREFFRVRNRVSRRITLEGRVSFQRRLPIELERRCTKTSRGPKHFSPAPQRTDGYYSNRKNSSMRVSIRHFSGDCGDVFRRKSALALISIHCAFFLHTRTCLLREKPVIYSPRFEFPTSRVSGSLGAPWGKTQNKLGEVHAQWASFSW